jgi:hypothetical protein
MSHWAEIDNDNKVLRVLVGDNNDPIGDEGYQWLIDNLGGTWIKTSYNASTNGFRKNFAGIGYTYDQSRDAFIAPKPFDSWLLDEGTCRWQSPTPMPVEDGKVFKWDEPTLAWVEVELPA